MFTKNGPNAVQSSDGFKVTIAKRFELNYEDKIGMMIVPIEPMEDGELVVSVSTILGNRKSELTMRISAALDFLGIRHRFD